MNISEISETLVKFMQIIVEYPCTFKEAICCENSEDWKQAMDKEIECLYKARSIRCKMGLYEKIR